MISNGIVKLVQLKLKTSEPYYQLPMPSTTADFNKIVMNQYRAFWITLVFLRSLSIGLVWWVWPITDH